MHYIFGERSLPGNINQLVFYSRLTGTEALCNTSQMYSAKSCPCKKYKYRYKRELPGFYTVVERKLCMRTLSIRLTVY